ncbi:MAG: hypothetical protein HY931_04195 [Candidatus Falkowbacteria bacterium]|nr:MAG: hypothetical protein HY931_04195 [Candidatus Falkowbacteria bacterium]
MIKTSSAATSGEPLSASEKSEAVISGLEAEKILEQLQQAEKLNREILRSVKFIKHYFAWQSVMSAIKYSLLAAVIILGVVSWRSIVDYTSQAIGNSLVGVSVPGGTIFK